MALIVPTDFSPFLKLRDVTTQATTGQTDWLDVPEWVKTIVVTFNLTANAGTTPESTITLRAPDPVSRDDTNDHSILLTSATITGASFHTYYIGEGLEATGTDSATADSFVAKNTGVPSTLGIRVLNDRTTGNETYTYTLTVRFRG